MRDDNKAIIRSALQQKILDVCDRKIAEKGPNVGLSFYAFFANKNDDPELLMEAAEWWIKTHQFDHFEKATKIRAVVAALIADERLCTPAPIGRENSHVID
ncbi:DUF6500 family protein [Burkholderia ubonensis]|uniref:DUF6500 family protein n=1 Tax=Burkholderia ubonensis TaxID=101571 RepID=UPI001E29A679|nr:DUF6500 family protein [Burkholderia ubonensis]